MPRVSEEITTGSNTFSNTLAIIQRVELSPCVPVEACHSINMSRTAMPLSSPSRAKFSETVNVAQTAVWMTEETLEPSNRVSHSARVRLIQTLAKDKLLSMELVATVSGVDKLQLAPCVRVEVCVMHFLCFKILLNFLTMYSEYIFNSPFTKKAPSALTKTWLTWIYLATIPPRKRPATAASVADVTLAGPSAAPQQLSSVPAVNESDNNIKTEQADIVKVEDSAVEEESKGDGDVNKDSDSDPEIKKEDEN